MKMNSFFTPILLILALVTPPVIGEPESQEELWKGSPYPHHVSFALVQGLGFPSGPIGYVLNGYVGINILRDGFIPDINDQAYLEAMVGAMFGGGDAVNFAGQLRWDLHKDYLWTFYGLGGLQVSRLGSGVARTTRLVPRVGVGAFWHFFEGLSFRAEVTQEMIGVGIATAL